MCDRSFHEICLNLWWIKMLKKVIDVLIEILNKSKSKTNKQWVDQGG